MDDARLSLADLQKRLTDAASRVKVGGRYVHYKGADKTYTVKELVITEATNEVAVIYEAEYAKGLSFMRPLSDWLATVSWNGKNVGRFTHIEK